MSFVTVKLNRGHLNMSIRLNETLYCVTLSKVLIHFCETRGMYLPSNINKHLRYPLLHLQCHKENKYVAKRKPVLVS